MVDPLGRTIDYLRVSVTDRCNLRCIYCMPSGGVGWMPHNEIMRFEELLTACRVLAALGIRSVKVTGGEPLVRRGVVDFIGELKAVSGIERVSLTSNGILLGQYLPALAAAGLNAVNVSLDTLDDTKYMMLTRSEAPVNILPALDQALELGLNVKVNCVPLRGYNEDDIVRLADLARNKKITVRFIELMPLGAAAMLEPVPASEVISLIEKAYGSMQASAVKLGNGPASYYTLPGFAGHIGLISAVSHGFCESCNRLRLTASGILKPCLSSDLGFDIRSLVRSGASAQAMESAVHEMVAKKPAGHSFGGVREKRDHGNKAMFRIGG